MSLVKSFALSITFIETFDAAGRVHELLVTREERMAGGTDLDTDVLPGGPGMDHVSASACDRGRFIGGVNISFHVVSPVIFPHFRKDGNDEARPSFRSLL